MQRFDREIAQLRALGFAEALHIEPSEKERGVLARLEYGQIGVAVEFHPPDAGTAYSVVSLLPSDDGDTRVTSNAWPEIVDHVRRCLPDEDD